MKRGAEKKELESDAAKDAKTVSTARVPLETPMPLLRLTFLPTEKAIRASS